jgi:transposase InsO family protein
MMGETVSASANRAYGLARVCRVWQVARSTIYHQRNLPIDRQARRPGPIGAATDADLVAEIRAVIEAAPFYGEGYRKVWARLRLRGVRTAERRVQRLMREHDLSGPNRPPQRPANDHDGRITTDRVDTTWGTDMAQAVLASGARVHVFATVDHCNSECIGVHAAFGANRWEALEPVRQGVGRHFGPAGADVAAGLKLRHDHGSNYMAEDFQREIAFLGMEASPSFVREPEGNGVAERFFRTLKEQLLWVRTFHTMDELQDALRAFRVWYNANWLLQRHSHRTPDQVRDDQQAEAMAATSTVMAA